MNTFPEQCNYRGVFRIWLKSAKPSVLIADGIIGAISILSLIHLFYRLVMAAMGGPK